MNRKLFLSFVGMLSSVTLLQAATNYVATTGNDTNSGSFASPFLTIQKAVDVALTGGVILVGPGTYATGENTSASATYGRSRVAITRNITVRSLQGAERTIILGQAHPSATGSGGDSIRCVVMTEGVLDGFTLKDGYADTSKNNGNMDDPIINGGGVCVPVGFSTPVINNCIITGCSAYRGAAAYHGTLNNCTLVNNKSVAPVGVILGCVWSTTLNNSIVRFNVSEDFASSSTTDESKFSYCCLPSLPGNSYGGLVRNIAGNITADPEFQAGTFIPKRGSPCIDNGTNAYVNGTLDASGLARVHNGIVDIGAYEVSFLPYTLTVVNGQGSGTYTNGDVVSISFTNSLSPWVTFTGWTGDTNTVANVLAQTTTLIMPRAATTVTANYLQLFSLDQIINDVLDIPLPIATSNVTVFSVNPVVPSLTLGPVTDGDVAFFETVFTNAGTVVFSWNVDSETGYDFLNFYVDGGAPRAQISGRNVSGVVTQFVGVAGEVNVPHRLRWEYRKNNWPGSSAGTDQGKVGPILWIPNDLASELGVSGTNGFPSRISFPYGQPGSTIPFPYGFQGCYLDRNPPAGATNGMAVKLGGTNGVLPLVANNQSTGVEVILKGEGKLSFQWFTACQMDDRLVLSVDGVEKRSLTGDRNMPGLGWTNVTVDVAGVMPHVVRWSYSKDGSGSGYADCGWVDNVVWTRTNTCTLTVNDGLGSGTYYVGDTANITATNSNPLKVFGGWRGDLTRVADTNSASTTVYMISNTVVSAYYPLLVDELISQALDIPLPIAVSNVTLSSVNTNVPSVTLGGISDGDVSYFETVFTNAGTVVFSWNVSSEDGWDFLAFSVDDVTNAWISGEMSGVVTQFVANVGSGLTNEAHRLRWEYSKDDLADSWDGVDQGEVGPIRWIPNDLATELGVPGTNNVPSLLSFLYGQPGSMLPFPYGFQGCYLDRSPPTGATNGMAIKLGGLINGVPFVKDSQATGVEVVLKGAGTLSFRWNTSCKDGDLLVCSVDGVDKGSLSGNRVRLGWTNMTVSVTGTTPHVVRWRYVKDANGIATNDCGWIDNVTWTRQTCTLTVQGGSGSGTYYVGDTATIVATNVTATQAFDHWSDDVANVDNVNSMTTTVYMASNTQVFANYKNKYTLTVENGTGSGDYFEGETVAVSALVPAGMAFGTWGGDTLNLADPGSTNTTFLMEARDVTITAYFSYELPVTVFNGWEAGSWPNTNYDGVGYSRGRYVPGAEVRIVANPAPLWKIFDYWTNSIPGVAISNATAEITSFTMPSNSVSLTAMYRDQRPDERLAEALTIRGQPLLISSFSSNGVVAVPSGGVRYDDPVVQFGGPSVGPGQSVSLTITNLLGDGTLLFWWRGDTETDVDGITVEVDGTPITALYSEKVTNTLDHTRWHLSVTPVVAAGTITFKYSRDNSYMVDDNSMLIDRVTWIPDDIKLELKAFGAPNINQEFDPCFNFHPKQQAGLDAFSGEDGGVLWDTTVPGGAIKIGNFGYVTNNQIAQVGFRLYPSAGGIFTWEWKTESESTHDRLEFLLDLIPTNSISGKTNSWTSEIFVLTSPYVRSPESPITDPNVTWPVFGFRYKKDYSLSFLNDAGWVRAGVWYPSYAVSVIGGYITNVNLNALNPAFATNPEVLDQVSKGIIPAGAPFTIIAYPPALTGSVFKVWSGILGGVITNTTSATQDVIMARQPISITANYDPPSAPASFSAPEIKNFMISETPTPKQQGMFAAAAESEPALGNTVTMTFEGSSLQGVYVEWSDSLSAPIWTKLSIEEIGVPQKLPDGNTRWEIKAMAPSTSPQGFFRLGKTK